MKYKGRTQKCIIAYLYNLVFRLTDIVGYPYFLKQHNRKWGVSDGNVIPALAGC